MGTGINSNQLLHGQGQGASFAQQGRCPPWRPAAGLLSVRAAREHLLRGPWLLPLAAAPAVCPTTPPGNAPPATPSAVLVGCRGPQYVTICVTCRHPLDSNGLCQSCIGAANPPQGCTQVITPAPLPDLLVPAEAAPPEDFSKVSYGVIAQPGTEALALVRKEGDSLRIIGTIDTPWDAYELLRWLGAKKDEVEP